MSRVLVIEDERKLLRALERGLRAEGYEVATAARGDEGAALALAQSFDAVILDWMLPGRDGLQVLSDLRRAGRAVPVLLLTARDAVEDRVAGLDAGADDYLVKPFALAELLARLRVLLRGRGERETVLRAGELELDLLERRVTRGGEEVPLTQREYEVLVYLLRHKNRAVTRDMLGRDVWKEPAHALTNVIDVYINSLRRKLERAGRPPLIRTLRGVGYSLRNESCD
jgi:two-component system, OmpR family, copper resistance phosphate regulon response regulator CusR